MESAAVAAEVAPGSDPAASPPLSKRLRRARFVLGHEARALVYPPGVYAEIKRSVDLIGEPVTGDDVASDPSLLKDVEYLFSGWGGPRLDDDVLAVAKDLDVLFYGAGSVRYLMTPAAWKRGLRVTSAAAANAISVAEFTVAQVTMCLKRIWQHDRQLQATRVWRGGEPGATGYGSRIGLVSIGHIGRLVAQRLADWDVEVVVYDIYRDEELAARFGFRYVGLEELFATSDVVSLHTPLLPATRHMISGKLLASMRQGASLINTSRGGIIDQAALVDVLRSRTDLFAVLDVVENEPLPSDSPLWDLENLVLLPHIAGARGTECERMGRYMLAELKRVQAGLPLRWELRAKEANSTA